MMSKQNINKLESAPQHLAFYAGRTMKSQQRYVILTPSHAEDANELFIFAHTVPINYMDQNPEIKQRFNRSFAAPKELVYYTPEGRTLFINYPRILKGDATLPSIASIARKGEGTRNLLLGSPRINFPIAESELILNPKQSIQYVDNILNNGENRGLINYHILMVSTNGVIPLDEILTSLPRQYTKIHLICCRS